MSQGLTLVEWSLCGIAALALFAALYTHAEGNRVTATRFVYHDIRREMGHHPQYRVWWRAFQIAMGWRKRAGSRRRNEKVISIRSAGTR